NMSKRYSRTIYVGNLPGDIREREVEDLFYKAHRISRCVVASWSVYEFHMMTFEDHMRRAGDVCFSEVFRDGGGELP
ncbi:hypothetical protein B296_00015618, partial [Ensete ventricosum]